MRYDGIHGIKNTTTGEVIQSEHSYELAKKRMIVLNDHEERNFRFPVYLTCELTKEELEVLRKKTN